ncbi:hypothetical protein [Erythrobacter sp. BLCC-B19]|uniref:hypothetical protein n=1 Tax=Erythrobacter sp. BLCC-B19 TaxID=3025315 RepID=UPI00235E6C5D|nr:hypothetical protein [Erythrobacter sp. BLCC-B19]WDA40981.1 hypothetical protein PS060_15720 [Erythrobacter sp. BLCC-B19]
MTAAPRLLAGRRRGLAAALVALAIGEALLVVLFAARLDQLLTGPTPAPSALAAGMGIAATAATALLLQRWVGESFAQGYVADCRAALYAAVVRWRGAAPSEGGARWLTGLINDMASLRNYALRGSVRLWTSATAAGVAGLWVALTMPQLRIGLVPLLLGTAIILIQAFPLSRAIVMQRRERGRLNRFMVRRVRADLEGGSPRKGNGTRKLASLSATLARAAVTRAAAIGAMEAIATLAGLAAALVLVWQAGGRGGHAGIAGHLTVIGFIAARLLESVRALHARIGGQIALDRLAGLIASAPPRNRPQRSGTTRSRAARAREPESAALPRAALAPPSSHLTQERVS